MSKEIEGAVLEFLEKMNSGLDVVGSHLPETLEQVINYTILSALIWQGVGVAILVLGSLLGLHLFRSEVRQVNKTLEDPQYDEYDRRRMREDAGAVGVITLLGSVILGLAFILANFGWIQPYFAPKMFLLEYIKELM